MELSENLKMSLGFCIMYTKHKNQNGYFKLSEYCEQYEGLENSDKGSAGLSQSPY